jgi:hypothetical protein
MDVRFELEITQLEQQHVAETLGCQDNEIGFQFSRHCACAAREYLDFYIKGVHPRSWNETLEYRFVLLVKNVFDNRIPREDMVARLFKKTTKAASSIMKNAISRYRYELQEAFGDRLAIYSQNAKKRTRLPSKYGSRLNALLWP